MSVALVLTTIDKGVKYVYVSGEESARDSQGFVIDGNEKLVQTENPWERIAFLQRSEVCMAFNMLRFDEAINLAVKASHNLDNSKPICMIFIALINIFVGYKNWVLFLHQLALENLTNGISVLRHHACYNGDIKRFFTEVTENIEFLKQFESKDSNVRSKFYLIDLISNAYRREEYEKNIMMLLLDYIEL